MVQQKFIVNHTIHIDGSILTKLYKCLRFFFCVLVGTDPDRMILLFQGSE